nr:hypothetical protein [uncultured Rhodopila sp.]
MTNHLLIAGTGRAGTSFLVRYLTELGLDTNLSRAGASAAWDERANAGLEDLPLPGGEDLPYVIKSPWTWELVHDLLERAELRFDAVIIPVRDLTEAAASRCILELQAQHERFPWMGELERTWEHVGHTPGGMVFSTSPVDQARLLAVGFHHLLERLVKADIPLIFLAFPRLIEDPAYLFSKLRPVLPDTISVEAGLAAHRATAEPSKVRVGGETRAAAAGFSLSGPSHAQLDRAALQRLLGEARRDNAGIGERLADAIQKAQGFAGETLRLTEALDAARQEIDGLTGDRDRTAAALDAARLEIGCLSEERDRLTEALGKTRDEVLAMTAERDRALTSLQAEGAMIQSLSVRLAGIEASTTWRIAVLLQAWAGRLPWAVPLVRRMVHRNRLWSFTRRRVEAAHAPIHTPRIPAAHAHQHND